MSVPRSVAPSLASISIEELRGKIKERDGLIVMQSQKIERLEKTVKELQFENADLRKTVASLTNTRGRDDLLRYKVRSHSLGGVNDTPDASSGHVKVATQASAGCNALRERSFRRTVEEIIKHSHAQNAAYELSQDLKDKQTEMLERRYGGSLKSRHAAKTIQRAYRQYCMNKNFQKLRNSIAERRLSKLVRSNTVWTDRIAPDAHYASVIQNGDLTNKQSLDAYVNDNRKRLTDANDSVRMKQIMSLDHGYNVPKMYVSGRNRKLKRSLGMDIIETGHMPNENSRLKQDTEENNNRNSYPEMNGSDCPQEVQLETVGDVHCMDSETFVDDKDTNIVGDSFQSDHSYNVKASMLSSHASGVSLASNNLRADTLGSNQSINSSYENFTGQSESGDSTSLTSMQIDASIDSVSLDQLKTQEQEHMNEQNFRYTTNHPEIKYLSQKESGQKKAISDSSKRAPVPGRVPEASPIWKRKNGSLSDSTGSIGKLDMKRMSNISETSEADSENHYSSSHSSENVSIENISGINDSSDYQRRLQASITLDKSMDKRRKRDYRIGLNLFNKKPEKGIAFFIENGFLSESPELVAHLLIARKGLSKQMIGEYLGNLQKQFNMSVLYYFCEQIDLSGLQVDMALRKFQSYFRMPGEAQKIERLMEVFAERYIDCNPDQVKNFRNKDTVLLLAFAIIMLNTDLHNASIKPECKMKLEDFIKNLRGIDDDEDVDRDLLVGIYDRIKNQEFLPGVDHVTQVMKVEQTIVGNNKPILALPHRRLVCYCRLYQVHDPNKKEKIGLHQREVFLFNDMLLVTKIFSRKKTGITYAFKHSCSLRDMQVQPLQSTHYLFGVKLVNNLDGKVLIMFNARNENDLQKFIDDLKEAISECNYMEQLRIDEQQQKSSNRLTVDRHYSNDDTRIDNYNYMKMSDPSFRLSVPNYNDLKQSFPLSNSLTDLCGAQAMRRGSSIGSLDSGVHSGSMVSANSTETFLSCHDSQSSLTKGHIPTSATITTSHKQSAARKKVTSAKIKRTNVSEGTEV